jgi:ABC-type bacteriocin/lantibiotic exporter with double-glycine peptidase domain
MVAAAFGAPAALWLDVPFVRQAKNGCGPATVSMVLEYWRPGSADLAKIERSLYSPQAQGTFASDIERFFRQQGFDTFAFTGEWDDLAQHLSKGRPLIVSLGKTRHYVVVSGLDEGRGLVAVNDPARRKLLQLDRKSFERDWSAAGRWALLAVPAQKQ